MKSKHPILFIAILLILECLCLNSCKTTENITSPKNKAARTDDLEKVNLANKEKIQNIWIKKIQGRFYWNNEEMSFKANYRIRRDSIIMISFMNPIGIEALRIICTTDSFTYIDRINREYFLGDYNAINKKTGYLLSFNFIQSVLMNEIPVLNQQTIEGLFKTKKPLIIQNNRAEIKQIITDETENNVKKEIYYSVEFETKNLNVVRCTISDSNSTNKINLEYGNHQRKEERCFPESMIIKVESNSINLKCSLILEKVIMNSYFDINYSINPKYKQIDW